MQVTFFFPPWFSNIGELGRDGSVLLHKGQLGWLNWGKDPLLRSLTGQEDGGSWKLSKDCREGFGWALTHIMVTSVPILSIPKVQAEALSLFMT